MTTPARAIKALDAALAKAGQSLKFKRGNSAIVPLRGFVRGFKPEELVGTIKQGDRSVVLSPTDLGAFGVPRDLDKVLFLSGSTASVQSVEQIHILDVLVRVNVVVRGD